MNTDIGGPEPQGNTQKTVGQQETGESKDAPAAGPGLSILATEQLRVLKHKMVAGQQTHRIAVMEAEHREMSTHKRIAGQQDHRVAVMEAGYLEMSIRKRIGLLMIPQLR